MEKPYRKAPQRGGVPSCAVLATVKRGKVMLFRRLAALVLLLFARPLAASAEGDLSVTLYRPCQEASR